VNLAKLGQFAAITGIYFLIGTLPLAAGWRLSGPFGGSARSIAIAAQNRNLLIVGARDSLLFRSDDAGATWRLLPFPQSTPGTFDALAIDPKAPNHFYAGLDAGDTSDSGLYESTDGGDHWAELPGLRGLRVESLSMYPGDPLILAAGTSRGIFLTKDGGATWHRISNENNREMQDITALAFDPNDSNRLYAGTPHLPWKTNDSGATWHSIHTGLIDDSDIFSIRVNPKRPELLFASACSGIYRSENSGESWAKLRGIPGTHRRTHIIAEDPRDSDTVFAGTTLGLFKTPDGGKTWQHLNSEQVNWMVFDPTDPKVFYLATEYAGVLKSTDSGATFQSMNHGFSNHSLTQITSSGKRIYASSIYEGRYGGVFSSEDGGLDWKLRANQEALLGYNVHSLVAGTGDLLFAASTAGILKSADAGKTWAPLPNQPKLAPARPGLRATSLRVHALQAIVSDKVTLFAGTDKGLFRSLNGGTSWEQIKPAGFTGVPVVAVYTASHGSGWVAARTAGELFVSDDAGKNWHSAALPDSSYFIYDVALPLDHDAPLLVATSRGLLQSFDGGAKWKLVSEGVPAATVNAVRYHPDRKLEVFLVQYGKIYRSLNGGTSWTALSDDGLANASIRALWFAPEIPGRIIALSSARGTLTLDMPQADLAGQSGQQVVSSKEIK